MRRCAIARHWTVGCLWGTRASTASAPCPCPHACIGIRITVLGQGQRRYSLFFPLLTVGDISQRAGLWCGTWPHGQTPVDTGWCANPMPETTSGRCARLLLMGANPDLTQCVVHTQRVGHGARGSAVGLAVPGHVPAGEHAADSLTQPRRPEGPAVGPRTSLQARRSIRRRPHSSCPLSSNACGPTRLRQDATRGRPARTTVPRSQPKALAGAHGEIMVLRAVVDVGRLRPRLACPPSEMPTRGQSAHISAARSWHRASWCCPPPHRSSSLLRDASAIGEAARSGMVLALL